ncbi:hypothetical protein QMK19_24040 [Streptomyces sp. H10-C2]|uniref:hypothetical protein n=1 Tax=unclassified Streptomyces TaxID=2593676 RepID=UPI0024BBCE2F|nr:MULTISPECIES: hypothetical protein [unclassified Streptomyces]MDJ0342877.1 hypothetical protein [Streptomyces sp. PH10-H1]MDJ0372650.1 hypothetical protein [Streptomyces sp. H10-C2]
MLGDPRTVRVAGDDTAGIYRRTVDADAELHPGAHQEAPVPEAYTWCNLTSGNGSRAMWLLLLPFMVANLAHWMRPPTGRAGLNRAYDVLVRLIALTLTLALVAAVCEVAMDLVGWQCAGTAGCVRGKYWLGFAAAYGGGWWSEPGRRLALSALVPGALTALLWWLSHRTWYAYESQRPAADNRPRPGAPALALPGFWYGRRLVARLRSAHTAAGALTAATALLVPTLHYDHERGQGALGVIGWALAGLLAVLAAATVTEICRAGRSETERDEATDHHTAHLLLGGGPAALVAAALYAGWHRPGWTSTGRLPAAATFTALTLLQGALIAALAVTAALMHRAADSPRAAAPAVPHQTAGSSTNGLPTGRGEGEGPAEHVEDGHAPGGHPGRAVLHGLGGPAVALLACALGGVLSGGACQRIADWLDRGATPGQDGGPLQGPPVLLTWQASIIPVLLVVLAGVVAVGAWRLWRERVAIGKEMAGLYPGESRQPARTRQIAGAIARAGLTDSLALLVAVVCTVAFLLGAGAVVGAWTGGAGPGEAAKGTPGPLPDVAQQAQALGSWLVGAGVVALLALGRRAYRDASARRTVGILWDVGTFWPRAAHPFAPPCYAERAVPDLTWRMATWTARTGGRIILSGHSQGSVLAAAAVWQLDPATRRRIALLTYGCPLERLYGRWFPAYFGPPQLRSLHRELSAWRNLWRRTDPIGGAVRVAEGPVVDCGPLKDPVAYGRTPEHPLPEPVLGHSGFQADPAFAAERTALLRRLLEAELPVLPASSCQPVSPTPPGLPVQGSSGRSSG